MTIARLVEHGVRRSGWLARRPVAVNPLDEFGGLSRMWRRLRLKEWMAFTLVHPEVYSSMIIQDAHVLASSEFYACDVASGEFHQRAANARGGSVGFSPGLFGGRFPFRRPGFELVYEFGASMGSHRVCLDLAATADEPAVAGELELDGARSAPALSVSAPLPGGAMYTHKTVFPVSGVLRVGGRRYVFDAARDVVILDEHKSFLPYRTRWLWGTFAAVRGAGVVGANFVRRPRVPGSTDESGVWTPSGVQPLAEVTFDRASGDPLAPCRMSSADGRLDVRFDPVGRKTVRHQLGVFAIDYVQVFGVYSGRVRGVDGEFAVESVHGVCEDMCARL